MTAKRQLKPAGRAWVHESLGPRRTPAEDAEALPAHAERHRLTPEPLMFLTADPGRRRDRPVVTRALEQAGLNRPCPPGQ
ncbi:hypothetical protein [Streptomyces sp. NPDC046832]|uniref:hypothetical protein n=1 Tax=Streptomyces sp. NPDC046832 TaxID=3155020 RepID=UPI0033D3DD70